MVQTISEQAGDALLQAQASRALGTLYSKVGNFEAAVEAFQRHFHLIKAILLKNSTNAMKNTSAGTGAGATGSAEPASKVTNHDLDLARVYVGISKGNLLVGVCVMSIQNDLTSLLDWKLNRTEITIAEIVVEEEQLPVPTGDLARHVTNATATPGVDLLTVDS